MTDIETIQAVEKELREKIPGLRTRVQNTQGAGSWLDISNGEKGMSIRCLEAKFALSVLPEEDDADSKLFNDKNLLIGEISDYLK
jgi:hypothetical protein